MDRIHELLRLVAIAALVPPATAQTTNSADDLASNDNSEPQYQPWAWVGTEPKPFLRTTHGVLAATPFLVLFPLGAMTVAIFRGRGRWVVWVHGALMGVGSLMVVVGIVLGIVMDAELRRTQPIEWPWLTGDRNAEHGQLLTHIYTGQAANRTYVKARFAHIYLGAWTLGQLVVTLAALGLHYWRLARGHVDTQNFRQAHTFFGRVAIASGVVAGGVGIVQSSAPRTRGLVYMIVAVVLPGAWVVITVGFMAWRMVNGKGQGQGQGQDGLEARNGGMVELASGDGAVVVIDEAQVEVQDREVDAGERPAVAESGGSAVIPQ